MEIKLCKDCKHFVKYNCHKFGPAQIDYVLGHHQFLDAFSSRRGDLDKKACGPEGKFWEAKDEN